VFRMFAKAGTNGSGGEAQANCECTGVTCNCPTPLKEISASEPETKAPCRADLLEARKRRKDNLVALKQTTLEVTTYRATRLFKKDKI
jgi:hypothetical protein